MKYKVNWIDATLTENYSDLVKDNPNIQFTNEGSQENDQWTDFSASHEFRKKNDKEAIDYIKSTFDFGGRNVDCFTLRGIDTGLYWTEEDWNAVAFYDNLRVKERTQGY